MLLGMERCSYKESLERPCLFSLEHRGSDLTKDNKIIEEHWQYRQSNLFRGRGAWNSRYKVRWEKFKEI